MLISIKNAQPFGRRDQARPDNIDLRFVEGHLEKYFVVITKGYDHRKGQPNEYWDRAMNCDVVEHIQCQF